MSSENINYIYKQTKSKGADYIGAILFVFLVCSVYGYLYTSAQNKLLQLSWNEQRCNPRYLFFSGFLNPLYKDPWTTTETNFNRCVATSMYKDPNLSREIKRNDKFIKLHDVEIKQNLATGENAVEEIRKQWEEVKDKKDMDVQMAKSEAGGIFEKQGYMHNTFTEKTSQMFQVLKSTIIYIQGILLYRISQHKESMDIDKTHEKYMSRYAATYEKYKQAFSYLDQDKWSSSMNIAREAIKEYDDLSLELREFMSEHEFQMKDINKSCYHLKYNLEDNSCKTLFPNLLETVDYDPLFKS